jgi:hypothetical protein
MAVYILIIQRHVRLKTLSNKAPFIKKFMIRYFTEDSFVHVKGCLNEASHVFAKFVVLPSLARFFILIYNVSGKFFVLMLFN